jgi:hypothetical protein
MVAVAMGLTVLTACSSSDPVTSSPVAPSATTTSTAFPESPLPSIDFTLSPEPSKAPATSVTVPASQPTRLDVDGAYPIHAEVLPYDGPINPLVPPDGNYHDLFVWTERGGGLAGDGATDATFVFGHTYSGPTQGVLDNLQNVVFDKDGQLVHGAPIRLTTETGELTYCVKSAYMVWQQELDNHQAFWAPGTFETKGDWLGIIACFMSEDGSSQTGKNLAVLAERC